MMSDQIPTFVHENTVETSGASIKPVVENANFQETKYTKSIFIQALRQLASAEKHIFPESDVWESLFFTEIPKISNPGDAKCLDSIATEMSNDF